MKKMLKISEKELAGALKSAQSLGQEAQIKFQPAKLDREETKILNI